MFNIEKKVDYCTDCPCLYVFLSSKKSDRNMFSFHIKPFSALTVRELHAVTSLREQVFYLEQRVTTLDADAKDLLSVYLWVESEGETVGTLRMIPRGVSYPEASIGRVSVLPSFRHRGICRQMMQRAIEYMEREWNVESICISAQSYLISYYESIGFHVVSDEYLEAGIRHRKMLWNAADQG